MFTIKRICFIIVIIIIFCTVQGKFLTMNQSGGLLVGNQTLVVQGVEVERRGLYTCIASNAVGDSESNAVSLDIKCTYIPYCTNVICDEHNKATNVISDKHNKATNSYAPSIIRRQMSYAGLGTAFFYVLNTSFFCVLFSSFWRLMKPKRMMRSFAFFS